MAVLDISSKLGFEKQEILIAPGKLYEVDCSAETMLKAQDIFKKNDSIEGIFDAIKLLIGEKGAKDIRAMKLTVKDLRTVMIGIMSRVNEMDFEEMEKRFQDQ